MRKVLVFIFVWMYLSNVILHAQWEFVGSPEIAKTYWVDGNRDSLFLCAGAGLFFSSNQGDSWRLITTPDTVASFFHVEYTNGNLYLLATTKNDFEHTFTGLYRSSDLGSHWIDISPFLHHRSEAQDLTVNGDTLMYIALDSIAISFNRGDTFFNYKVPPNFAHYAVINSPYLFMTHHNFIIRSPDFGKSWDTIYTMPSGHYACELLEMDNVLWHIETYFNSNEVLLRKSVDHGATWQLVKKFTLGDINPRLTGGNGHLFLFSHLESGFLYSPDHGLSWSEKQPNNSLSLYYIDSILIGVNETEVKKSPDFGDSFMNANKGLTAADILHLVVGDEELFVETRYRGYKKYEDSTSWDPTSFLRLARVADGTIYASTTFSSLDKSSDGGKTWKEVPFSELGGAYQTHLLRLQPAGNKIYLGGPYQIWWSTSHMPVWQQILDPDLEDSFFEFISYQDGKYVGTDINEQIFISDDGISWDNITFDFPELDFLSARDATFIYYHQGATYIFMNDFFGKLQDGTHHWQSVTRPVPSNINSQLGHPVTFLSSYQYTLIAGVYGYGVFISNDEGNTWTTSNEGLTDFQINSGEIVGNEIYLGVNGGVWKRPVNELLTTSISQVLPTATIRLSPMPAIDFISISSEDPCLQGEVSISIFDLGGLLLSEYITSAISDYRIDLADVPPGIYFMQIRSPGCSSIQKVIKL